MSAPIGWDRGQGPLRSHPRAGGPDRPDGPLRLARGPLDHEGLGRERFWDQTPEERADALPAMVQDSNLDTSARVDLRYFHVANESKAFARGWLAELERAQAWAREASKKIDGSTK